MKKKVDNEDIDVIADKKESKIKSFFKRMEYAKTIKRFLLIFIPVVFLEFMFAFFVIE